MAPDPGELDELRERANASTGPAGTSRSALGFSFEIATADVALAAALEAAFSDLAPSPWAAHRLVVLPLDDERHVIAADGEPAVRCSSRSDLVDLCCWFVNQGAIHHGSDLLLFHAAVVARDGLALVFPAASGSGKSTLAAAMVQAGFSYLSDEVGALDPSCFRLQAFPKPLSLDRASLELIGAHARLPEVLGGFTGPKLQLPASALRAGSPAHSAVPVGVVFPQLRRGDPPELVALGRTEALSRLVPNSFNLVRAPGVHFGSVVELCRRTEAFSLALDDPLVAAGLLAARFELLSARAPRTRAHGAVRNDRPSRRPAAEPEAPADPRPRAPGPAVVAGAGVTARTFPRVRPDVLRETLDDEVALFDPKGQQLVVLNRSASLVWSCCDGTGTAEEIATDIADAFAVSWDEVNTQVSQLIEEWAVLGLLADAG